MMLGPIIFWGILLIVGLGFGWLFTDIEKRKEKEEKQKNQVNKEVEESVDLSNEILTCCCCDYAAEQSKWSKIEITSADPFIDIVGEVYDLKEEKRINVGVVELFACPHCKTVIFN